MAKNRKKTAGRVAKKPQGSSAEAGDVSYTKGVTSPDVKSLWVDRMQVLIRADAPIALLRFFTFLPPEHSVEVSRLTMTVDHAKEMVNVLAKNLNYFPTPEPPKPPSK